MTTDIQSPPAPAEGTLTVADAATQLGVSERTVWRYLKAGRLDGVTVGAIGSQRTLIPQDSIDALHRTRTAGAADPDAEARLAHATAELERLQAECDRLHARIGALQRALRRGPGIPGFAVLMALAARAAERLRARTAAA